MDEREGRTFVDRHPEDRGLVLWCALCGQGTPAEALDWEQLCPRCARWWRDNPPPGQQEQPTDIR